jgi:hypothetical protein
VVLGFWRLRVDGLLYDLPSAVKDELSFMSVLSSGKTTALFLSLL